MADLNRIKTPPIQALGIVQEGAPDRWHASGYVAGLGWLEARGKSLVDAMEALQALAARHLVEHAQQEDPHATDAHE